MSSSGSVIVSWDFSDEKDTSVLIVGNKTKGQAVEIINAFVGLEAHRIHELLTTKGLTMESIVAANNSTIKAR